MLWRKLLVYGPVVLGPMMVVGPWFTLRLGGGPMLPTSPWAVVAGTALFVVGVAVMARCVWDFGHVGRGTPVPFDAPREHVTVGLYRHMRNPMMAGMVLTLLGEAVAYLSAWLLGYALAVWLVLHLCVVLYEERTLRRKFGDPYREYCASVSRWIPHSRRAPVA
ncbi:isoprenylcysteine carboxylmethyltransferase family protein [Candidatus Poribacteria bacterium]|jgi:protein-S-isoprenylcysteine O-methyltransferase Ste14|nr:isoprenylcysteine carboxylmethyltransferase family protein [Candidatus Poribacteria bacterium]MBT5535480.1 isoprenylcysteine carboxylmethyltransferase family protein [Candidatus Poribacteria bacterium]MBT5714478.1 isoprenylcysteine carboxylmethyltransferase family protein [Candidatus Poribacteria bacterium]MBT7096251.1 isoprenylcysteine carboxylmethyltransferase family protein [Candidatus Poribacteria bacterium]MBT7806553.1 isoprenylcysteine carboxylmethyltransferase family protein [Candidat